MLFTTPHFLLFLSIIGIIHYTLPMKYRWIWLLASSYYFYSLWHPFYAVLLAAMSMATYLLGRLMDSPSFEKKKKVILFTGVILNVGLLFIFKYFNMLVDLLKFIPGTSSSTIPAVSLILPLGISFYTFKSISYLADLYKHKITVEKHPGHFALYVIFFPQILAGPIERSGKFLAQLQQNSFDYNKVTSGLKLFLWGLFIKVVIADRLAVIVNTIYGSPENYGSISLITATYLYAIQIYCDFAGYSDMAIGAARILGFDTTINFRQPYFAVSISDFWRRWHITLSSWFRDYLYIPLGGNRVNTLRWCINIIIVFLVSGLWHGAAITFLIWGLLHGIYLSIEHVTQKVRDTAWDTIKIGKESFFRKLFSGLCVFHLVTFSWIFFRAENVNDALLICRNIFSNFNFNFSEISGLLNNFDLTVLITGIAIVFVVNFLQYTSKINSLINSFHPVVRFSIYISLALAIVNLKPVIQTGFIYLNF